MRIGAASSMIVLAAVAGCGQQLVELPLAGDAAMEADLVGTDGGVTTDDLAGGDGGVTTLDLAAAPDLVAGDMATAPDLAPPNGPRCHAVLFDGVRAIVTAPPVTAYNPAALALEAWVYPTSSVAAVQVIAGHWVEESSNSDSYLLQLDATGKASFRVTTLNGLGGTVRHTVTAPAVLPRNTWSHVAGVFSSTDVLLFVNGAISAQEAVGVLEGGPRSIGNVPLHIGRMSAASTTALPFKGYLDEVRLSSSARYTTPFAPAATFTDDATTVSLYHFDETSGAIAADAATPPNTAMLAENAQFAAPPACN